MTDTQSDGKIIVVGSFNTYSGMSKNGIFRLNSDGTYDSTFNSGTGVSGLTSSYARYVNYVAVQPDNKILIAGSFTRYNGTLLTSQGFIRLNSDGTLDTSFNNNLGTAFYTTGDTFQTGQANVIKILPDGKILLLGGFTKFNNVNVGGIIRLNSDGTSNSC